MVLIGLTKGYSAQVDEVDADLAGRGYYASVNSATGHVYAKRNLPRHAGVAGEYLHRVIAARMGDIPPAQVVDHINGDTLDCTRANLRVVAHRRNLWNQHGASRNSKSGVRGVYQKRGRWMAYICVGPRKNVLGMFDTIEEARAARLAAERERELSAGA